MVLEASIHGIEVNPAETGFMVGKTLIMGGLQQLIGLSDQEAFELAYKWFVFAASRGSTPALREIANMFAVEIAKLVNELKETQPEYVIYQSMIRESLYFEDQTTADWSIWNKKENQNQPITPTEQQMESISSFLNSALKNSLFNQRTDFENKNFDFDDGTDPHYSHIIYPNSADLLSDLKTRPSQSTEQDPSLAALHSHTLNNPTNTLSQLVDRHLIYLRLAAEFGEPEAQYEVGTYYLNSIFLKQDTHKAFDWILEASSNKSLSAILDMVDLVRTGIKEIGLKPSSLKALSLVNEAQKISGIDFSELKKELLEEAKKGN